MNKRMLAGMLAICLALVMFTAPVVVLAGSVSQPIEGTEVPIKVAVNAWVYLGKYENKNYAVIIDSFDELLEADDIRGCTLKYDEGFFEDKALIALAAFGSGSFRYSVDSVVITKDNEIGVNYSILHEEWITDDNVSSLILVELDRADVEGAEEVLISGRTKIVPHGEIMEIGVPQISAGTSVSDFSELTELEVKVYDTEYKEISGKDLIGTGCVYNIYDADGVTARVGTATVRGDLDGDGRVTAVDARMVLRASATSDIDWNVNRNYFYAADVAEPNGVTASDARKILRVSAKVDTF